MSAEPLMSLRQLARERPDAERCDLCGATLGPSHLHLVELAGRRLQCACDACAILFDSQADQRYRLVPQGVRRVEGFALPDALWDELMVPVGMAFFFHSSAAGRVIGMYPSPAGATESLLELASWRELESANPVLRELAPDVEALLVNRVLSPHEHYLLGVDRCYELVGLIRVGWRGLSGGGEVRRTIARYFAELRERSRTVGRGDA